MSHNILPLSDGYRPMIHAAIMDSDTPESNARTVDVVLDEIHALMEQATTVYEMDHNTSDIDQAAIYADAASHARDLMDALQALADAPHTTGTTA
ncbi:hypothetical protein ACT3SZ_14445 [Corynebacterium sp. AOP40-9SA-29]|uniref:hypothetical protein n=1 Tax=Corynebacterium sp. AOP40-9SA-29 TaxID=3457677 RepID=UPI0040337D08